MYYVCDYYENIKDYVTNMKRFHNIKEAIRYCQTCAKEYKAQNEDVKLLDYERAFRNEKLAYGVYCFQANKLVKEYRVYEN